MVSVTVNLVFEESHYIYTCMSVYVHAEVLLETRYICSIEQDMCNSSHKCIVVLYL